jgi:glycosyltransferase involved in cell wall biosynthesis
LHLLPDLEVGGGQVLVLQTLRAMPADVHQVVCALRGGSLHAAYEQAGLDVEIVGGRGPVTAVARTARVARQRGADLVHTNHTATDRVIGQATGLACRLPVVNTFHGMAPAARRGDPVRGLNLALAHTNIRRFVAVSKAVAASYAAALRLRPERITVVHPGLPPEAFAAPCPDAVDRVRGELGIDPADRVVIVVARLVAGKGHVLALEALQILRTGLPAARLLLVGDGPERAALELAAQRLDVGDRVDFLGRRADVPVLLALADVALSASESEGFPLNVLEAMAAARPVVAARLPAYDDFVVDGESGALVSHEPRALAEALHRLLSRPDVAAGMAAAGQRSVALFTTAATAAGLLDVYASVVDRQP